jgi:hypothetical protein
MAVVDSAEVAVDSTAVAVADTTNREFFRDINFNSSLLRAGCCCFRGYMSWVGREMQISRNPTIFLCSRKDRKRQKFLTPPFPLSNAV